MRGTALFLAAATSALILPACVASSDCDPSRIYPRCDAVDTLERCFGGQVYERETCDTGSFCLEGTYDDGTSWAACVRDGTETCDMDVHVPVCRDDESIWVCSSAGHTQLVSCPEEGEGLVCKTSPVRAACTRPGAVACDPASFEETCDGNRPIYCDVEFGFIGARAECASPEVCKVGEKGPVCTAVDSAPCDYLDHLPSCVQDSRLTCDPFDAFTELEPCGAGEQCLESAAWPGARCFGSDAVPCDGAAFLSRCEDGQRIVCNGFGVEEATACEAGAACRVSDRGGFCVEPDAQTCDPAAYQASCDGDAPLLCDTRTGFTRHASACAAPQVCKSNAFGARCVDPDSQLCAQDEFSCDGADMIYCLNGFTERMPCEDGRICVPDPFAWLFGLSCVDPAAPSCEVSEPASCDGSSGRRCAGGYVSEFDCGEDARCATDGHFVFCVPADTPSCDPLTYDARCEDGQAHQCWDPGFELVWTCADGTACVEGETGPACEAPLSLLFLTEVNDAPQALAAARPERNAVLRLRRPAAQADRGPGSR